MGWALPWFMLLRQKRQGTDGVLLKVCGLSLDRETESTREVWGTCAEPRTYNKETNACDCPAVSGIMQTDLPP